MNVYGSNGGWNNQLPVNESVLEHWRKVDEAIARKEQEQEQQEQE